MQCTDAASSLHMVPTIDIDALLEAWAVRMSATASLAPDAGEAARAVRRMRLRLAMELSPRPRGWCPGFPTPAASREMRAEFLKLVFAQARRLLADDELLDACEFAVTLRTLSEMESYALDADQKPPTRSPSLLSGSSMPFRFLMV